MSTLSWLNDRSQDPISKAIFGKALRHYAKKLGYFSLDTSSGNALQIEELANVVYRRHLMEPNNVDLEATYNMARDLLQLNTLVRIRIEELAQHYR